MTLVAYVDTSHKSNSYSYAVYGIFWSMSMKIQRWSVCSEIIYDSMNRQRRTMMTLGIERTCDNQVRIQKAVEDGWNVIVVGRRHLNITLQWLPNSNLHRCRFDNSIWGQNNGPLWTRRLNTILNYDERSDFCKSRKKNENSWQSRLLKKRWILSFGNIKKEKIVRGGWL